MQIGRKKMNRGKLQRMYERRRLMVLPFWRKVIRDYMPPNPIPAKKIAAMYVNEQTGKPYTAQQIYKIINKYDQGEFSLEESTEELESDTRQFQGYSNA